MVLSPFISYSVIKYERFKIRCMRCEKYYISIIKNYIIHRLRIFNPKYFEAYKEANSKFCDVIVENLKPGDFVRVHDYQLMLLPQMIREKASDTTIGFILHIPFHSFANLYTHLLNVSHYLLFTPHPLKGAYFTPLQGEGGKRTYSIISVFR
jgi:glycogen synthase